jgi:uncharacterized protein YcnI
MRRSVLAAMVAAGLFMGGLGAAAQAHVVIADATARPASYFAAFFRVGHGCNGSPTISITIHIPEGVTMAKPQPKPGWTYTVATAGPDSAPDASHEAGHHNHGASHGVQPVRVTAITWNGHLKDSEFDEFGVLMKLPAGTGPLYFPTIQRCEEGELHWTQIPVAGQKWHDVPHPAPVLNLMAAP